MLLLDYFKDLILAISNNFLRIVTKEGLEKQMAVMEDIPLHGNPRMHWVSTYQVPEYQADTPKSYF